MKASALDLRYRMTEVLKALERRERVSLLYHGKVKGAIVPIGEKRTVRTADHPFFGMASPANESVTVVMDLLRGGRYR
jgi:antitoxin (DNA-binding transcriptional repressor) of toxin-antitoxin stability system